MVELKNGKVIERKASPIFKNESFAGWIAQLYDVTPAKKKKSK